MDFTGGSVLNETGIDNSDFFIMDGIQTFQPVETPFISDHWGTLDTELSVFKENSNLKMNSVNPLALPSAPSMVKLQASALQDLQIDVDNAPSEKSDSCNKENSQLFCSTGLVEFEVADDSKNEPEFVNMDRLDSNNTRQDTSVPFPANATPQSSTKDSSYPSTHFPLSPPLSLPPLPHLPASMSTKTIVDSNSVCTKTGGREMAISVCTGKTGLEVKVSPKLRTFRKESSKMVPSSDPPCQPGITPTHPNTGPSPTPDITLRAYRPSNVPHTPNTVPAPTPDITLSAYRPPNVPHKILIPPNVPHKILIPPTIVPNPPTTLPQAKEPDKSTTSWRDTLLVWVEEQKKCSLSVGTLSTAQAVTPVTPVTPKVVEDARVPTPLVQNLVVTETPSVLAALLQNRASSSTFMSATPMSATSMSATPKSATSMSATSKSIPPKSIPLLPQDFCTTTLWVDEHTIISTANPPEVCKATPRAQKDNARQSAPTPTPAPASVEEFPVALDKVRGPVRPKQSSDVSILRERSRRDKTKNVVAHTVEDSDSDVCIIKEQILKPTKKKKQALLKRRRAAHQCTQCSFKTFSISQLKSHEELHPTGRKIKCSKCPFETRLKSCMIYHASIHSGGKKFRCSKCSFKTNVLDLFVAHEALKHTCSVCHSEFHLRREFLRHITEAHRILRARFFVCRKCAFNSVDFTKIQKHKATHLGDQTVTVEDDGCVEMEDVERGDSIANNRGVRKKRAPKKNFKPSGTVKRKSKKQCAFNSVDFTKIQRHKASHLGNQTVTVEDDWCVEMEDVERGDSAANNRGVRKKRTPKPAKKNFKPSGTVKRKCKKQKPNFLKCHDCPFKCLNQTLMVKHRINKHLIPNPSINFNKKTDEYQCSVCSYVTDEKLFFVKHLRSHSQSPDPDDCSETQRQVEIFRCSFCDFETEFEKMMQSHLSTHSESDSDFDMDIPVDPDVDFSRPPSVCSGDSDPKTKTNQKISKKFTCVNCKFETNLKKRFKKHRSLHLRETVFNMVFTSIL